MMVAVVGAEGVLHPRRQAGCLIIQEEAAELNGWLTIRIRTFLHIGLAVLGDRSISPPVPRRDAQLTAQLIDAIDGATAVTTGNHNLGVDRSDDEFLAFSFQIRQF